MNQSQKSLLFAKSGHDVRSAARIGREGDHIVALHVLQEILERAVAMVGLVCGNCGKEKTPERDGEWLAQAPSARATVLLKRSRICEYRVSCGLTRIRHGAGWKVEHFGGMLAGVYFGV